MPPPREFATTPREFALTRKIQSPSPFDSVQRQFAIFFGLFYVRCFLRVGLRLVSGLSRGGYDRESSSGKKPTETRAKECALDLSIYTCHESLTHSGNVP